MSTTNKRYPLAQAQQIAQDVLSQLAPHCDRIEISGSIRRKCDTIGDIEIVCIPKMHQVYDLFGQPDGEDRVPDFTKTLDQWPKVKGCAKTGKYTQREHPSGMKLDVFMVNKWGWGLQLAIRTGPADYSHQQIASRWAAMGWKSVGGVLQRKDAGPKDPKRYFLEERDLFDFLRIPYAKPEDRRGKRYG